MATTNSKFKYCLGVVLALSSVLPACAQSTTGTFTSAPFVVGNPAEFAAAILPLNLQNFFGGANNYLFGNTASGTSVSFGSAGTNISGAASSSGSGGNAATTITSSRSFVNSPVDTTGSVPTNRSIFNNAFGSNVSGLGPVLVLTSLEDSPNPRTGSAGVLFQGLSSTSVTSVGFQYSPVSTSNGFTNSDLYVAPYLVVDDNSGRTKYFPITSALVASNYSINALNGNLNSSSTGTTGSTGTSSSNGTTLDNAFISVVFNTTQLGIQNPVRRIGLVQFKRGIVFVKDITVNGATSKGTLTQNLNTFPF
ncbi:MAG TPA: hypothetical protein V6C89_20635 [Drouetiella sp.]